MPPTRRATTQPPASEPLPSCCPKRGRRLLRLATKTRGAGTGCVGGAWRRGACDHQHHESAKTPPPASEPLVLAGQGGGGDEGGVAPPPWNGMQGGPSAVKRRSQRRSPAMRCYSYGGVLAASWVAVRLSRLTVYRSQQRTRLGHAQHPCCMGRCPCLCCSTLSSSSTPATVPMPRRHPLTQLVRQHVCAVPTHYAIELVIRHCCMHQSWTGSACAPVRVLPRERPLTFAGH
jgi:hypothetical protein